MTATTDVIRPKRPRGMVTDMLRSLALMAVVIAALLFLGPARALIFPGDDRRAPVDYAGQVRGFAARAGAAVPTPTGLPSSWRANAADLTSTRASTHLHIGWAVPGTAFAGLDEATGDPQSLLRSVLGSPGLTSRSTITLGGQTWEVRRSARGEEALTRQSGPVVVIVTGNATDAQLRLLAASLH